MMVPAERYSNRTSRPAPQHIAARPSPSLMKMPTPAVTVIGTDVPSNVTQQG